MGLAALALAWAASMGVRAQQGPPPAPQAPKPAPVQPLPYSHRQHLTFTELTCRTCHVNPDPGTLMTYPPTSVCMTCHETLPTDRAPLRQLAAFAASGKPIPWVRVYEVPDYVYWSHRSHLGAGLTCQQCHGPVQDREVIARETNAATMLGCVSCHDDRQVSSDCGFCHEPRQ